MFLSVIIFVCKQNSELISSFSFSPPPLSLSHTPLVYLLVDSFPITSPFPRECSFTFCLHLYFLSSFSLFFLSWYLPSLPSFLLPSSTYDSLSVLTHVCAPSLSVFFSSTLYHCISQAVPNSLHPLNL